MQPVVGRTYSPSAVTVQEALGNMRRAIEDVYVRTLHYHLSKPPDLVGVRNPPLYEGIGVTDDLLHCGLVDLRPPRQQHVVVVREPRKTPQLRGTVDF